MPHHPHVRPVLSRRSEGFTLAELLVVVAIVLVLVAIAVPIFSSALGNSEEAVCAANRRTLKGMVSNTYSMTSPAPSQAELEGILASDVANLEQSNGGKSLCPSGGTYRLAGTAANGSIIVKCSKHGAGMDEEMYETIGSLLEGKWYASAPSGLKGDDGARKKYASEKGIDSWPPVTGADGETYYLEFKSYNNSSDTAFLYAGKLSDPQRNDWSAKYLCDSTGLVGEKGQWYELPEITGIAMSGDTGESKMKALLEANKDNKVHLVGDKFVSAS